MPATFESFLGWVLFLVPPAIMAGICFTMLFFVIRAATARNGPVEAERHAIPVRAAFTGIRGIPWLAVATNNASPWFVMGPADLEYRVIRKHRRPYSDIEQVDVRTALGTMNIDVQFKGEILTLAVNVGTAAAARAALALFPEATPMTTRASAMRWPG